MRGAVGEADYRSGEVTGCKVAIGGCHGVQSLPGPFRATTPFRATFLHNLLQSQVTKIVMIATNYYITVTQKGV